ncbi:MAG TPA: DUF3558 family protein [Pseudonocardiaceae bacterium]|jgi:hypothetical protein|nr:DUF3558 family protein [Pseudonocardiaceae bacterium]
MRRTAVVGLGLLAVGWGAGCAAATDASRVDMCTILSDAELRQLGITPSTRVPVDRAGSVGCEWTGKPFILSLERESQTLASYRARPRGPAFISVTDNSVNGRAGLRFRVDRDGTDCEQLLDGGSVSLVVSVTSVGSGQDPCAEALRIARMIEPRLPKAAS